MIIYCFKFGIYYINTMREVKNKKNITVESSSDSSIIKKVGIKHLSSKKLKTDNNQELDSIIDTLADNLSNKHIKYDDNAIIYTRISSKNQSLGTSLESQLELCRQYCNENNFKILDEVSEVISARNMQKQEKLLEVIKQNSSFNLIVLEPSRISRNLCNFTNQIDIIKQNKITLHFVQDNLISSNSIDFKKIIAGIYDGELESETLSKRIKRSVEKRKINGTYYPSVPPYGYDYYNNFKDGKLVKNLVENEKEQHLIDLINNLYGGSKISDIETKLKILTGEKHELYFPKCNESTKSTEEIEYGNMKLIDIVNFLNSIPILRRNRDWNSNSVKQALDL